MDCYARKACNIEKTLGGKPMKKLMSALCAAVMLTALAMPTFAATKNDLINEIKAGVTVGDKVKEIPDKYVDLAEDFLAANDLTSEQLDTAMADLQEAKALWASTGETEFKNIPADVQRQLQNMAAESAKKVGATLTFDGKTIYIVDAQGRTYSVLARSSEPIKQTGGDYTTLLLASGSILAVLGGTVVLANRKRLAQPEAC